MKMRLITFLAITLLSISILSYGVNESVFADSHNIPPISASTELPTYGNGDEVVVSGNIRDYDSAIHSGQDITFVIKSPNNNLVSIGQITPSSNGSFQVDFIAGGALWKSGGDYVIEFHFGANSGETTIIYTGGVLTIEPPLCASNETLVNGVCVENEPPPVLTCASNETLVNGVCVENEPTIPVDKDPTCGPGTESINGICTVIEKPSGCLIATAAYGTELAPQVQLLREIRDNTLLTTVSGNTFMTGFNTLYYSFAPTISDWERESPVFKEAVRAFITPMISTLSIMALADDGSEVEVLGLGISVIALNLGMYIAAPALIGFRVHKHIQSRK